MKKKAKKEAEEEGNSEEEIKYLLDKKIKERIKKIDLFLNEGTFLKYREWICSEKVSNMVNIHSLKAGQILSFPKEYGNMNLFAMKAKHDEVIDSEYCLGYVIEVDGRRIGITGDTGLEPDGSIEGQYRELLPDLIVVHIGSIKEYEADYLDAKDQEERDACFYPMHSGILGVPRILYSVRPCLAVVSEFGEELKDQRVDICEGISKVINTKCLPGDIGLYIRISDLAVFCEVSGEFIPYRNTKYVSLKKRSKGYKIVYFSSKISPEETLDFPFSPRKRRKPLPERIKKNV